MTTYRDAGVHIDAKMDTLRQISQAVKATHTPAVLAGLGAFGGCFDLQSLAQQQPVLVASTDGIGTKTMVAAAVGEYRHLGADLVHHCVNDILCQGAQALFFMDYIAAAKLEPAMVAALIKSLAEACQAQGIALLGGETAEMPGVYQTDAFDIAGTLVGVVNKDQLIDGRSIAAGDVVLALPSSGLHTNGYSLARAVCGPMGYTSTPEILAGRTIGEALLEPHRCYAPAIQLLQTATIKVKGLVHITGGGIWDNIPRVVPDTLQTVIHRNSWQIPAIFSLIIEHARINEQEAFHVFNMGLGMLVILNEDDVDQAQKLVPELQQIGQIQARTDEQAAVILV